MRRKSLKNLIRGFLGGDMLDFFIFLTEQKWWFTQLFYGGVAEGTREASTFPILVSHGKVQEDI